MTRPAGIEVVKQVRALPRMASTVASPARFSPSAPGPRFARAPRPALRRNDRRRAVRAPTRRARSPAHCRGRGPSRRSSRSSARAFPSASSDENARHRPERQIVRSQIAIRLPPRAIDLCEAQARLQSRGDSRGNWSSRPVTIRKAPSAAVRPEVAAGFASTSRKVRRVCRSQSADARQMIARRSRLPATATRRVSARSQVRRRCRGRARCARDRPRSD